MNNKPLQDLAGAFNSIISMMLAALRARGLRGLLDLPNMIIAAIYLRRLGREFAALVAAFQAGTLPPLPASATTPDRQAACAHPAEPVATVPARVAAGRTGRARPVSAATATPAGRARTPKATRRRPHPSPTRAPAPRAIPALRPRPREADRRP